MISFLHTLFIFPITQLIELTFTFTQKIFKNPSISILAISAVINILCLPLYNAAEKWQEIERNTINRLKPQIDRIKSVFKGNERFLILQTLYRQNHYHPVFSLRSTFGLFLQIPFFIAAYSFISKLDVIKDVPFLFISNLGEPDQLFYYKNLSINILPLIMTLFNIFSGFIYSIHFQIKEKLQIYFIAILFLILLYNSPAALVIYWIANNLFSLIKNIFQKIHFNNKDIILRIILSLFIIYIPIHLLFFYNGNIYLRFLISGVFVFIILILWTLLILKHNNKNILNDFILKLFPENNFKTFFLALLTIWIITGIFLPARLISSSPQEFFYIDNYTTPFYFIINTATQSASLFILWPLLIYFLLKKSQKFLSFILTIFIFCSLTNIFLFPGNYGLISLELLFDNEPNHEFSEIIFNLAVLIIPIILVFILYYFKRKEILKIIKIICIVSLLFFSFYDLYTIDKEFRKVDKFKITTAETIFNVEPFFQLSKTGKNTVIIMLDRAISVFVPYIFEESPNLYESYSGFIFYPNTVSFNGHTIIGAPPLFGGYEYTPLEINKRDNTSIVTKHNESLLLMPRIFSEAGYKVTVTDPPNPNYSNGEDLNIYNSYKNIKVLLTDSHYTNLWLQEHDLSFASISEILSRNLLWYSLFRISPLALRQGIYLQGDWCAPGLMQKMILTLNGYAVLDFLPKLTGISSDIENTVLIMLNNTTHEPSFLQAPDYRPSSVVTNYGNSPFNKETAYHVNAAALKRLGEWFDFLKLNNLYDNTRIILVSDHGPIPNFLVDTHLPFNIEQLNPLLLVKDFNSNWQLKTDNTFMSNADVPYIAFEGQIENPINPFTGNKITNDLKLNPLYIAISGSIHLSNPNTNTFLLNPKKDYYVHTDIFNSNNWTKVEQ